MIVHPFSVRATKTKALARPLRSLRRPRGAEQRHPTARGGVRAARQRQLLSISAGDPQARLYRRASAGGGTGFKIKSDDETSFAIVFWTERGAKQKRQDHIVIHCNVERRCSVSRKRAPRAHKNTLCSSSSCALRSLRRFKFESTASNLLPTNCSGA